MSHQFYMTVVFWVPNNKILSNKVLSKTVLLYIFCGEGKPILNYHPTLTFKLIWFPFCYVTNSSVTMIKRYLSLFHLKNAFQFSLSMEKVIISFMLASGSEVVYYCYCYCYSEVVNYCKMNITYLLLLIIISVRI